MWFSNLLRGLFIFLDNIVYSLISTFYQLLMYLANLDLFGMSTIDVFSENASVDNAILKFSSRIYALLGIFMLFRISFSILQYMVNPDAFSDKTKGFGKLITNVLVTLVLIVTVPLIFQFGYKVQGVVLKENLIGKLILGADDGSISATNGEMAEDLKFLVFASLFSVDTDVIGTCKTGPVLGTKAMAQAENCLEDLESALGDKSGKLNSVFKTSDSSTRDFNVFGDLVNEKKDDKYIFKYTPILTTFAGGFIAIMMLSFCLDVAIRIIKLAFLEIIAPIPIISYIDPNQSGNGGMLSKWGKECFNTFASLFIRIAIIYFAFYLIDLVTSSVLLNDASTYLNGDAPEGLMVVLVQVMVIFGVLYFTKEVPKLLESIFGVKGGNITLNPMKRINESPLVSGALGFAGGALGGGIANGITAASNFKDRYKLAYDKKLEKETAKIPKHFPAADRNEMLAKATKSADRRAMLGTVVGTVTSVAGGMGSAGARGGVSGFKNKDFAKGAHEGRIASNDARNNRDTRQGAGYGVFDQVKDRVNVYAGIKNKAGGMGQMDQEIKQMQRDSENYHLREHATRDAMANMIANSPVSADTMESFMFEAVKDNVGNIVTDDVTGKVVYKKYDDDNVPLVKQWSEIDQTKAEALGITEDLYTRYSTSEHSALSDDASIEKIRKEIKKREDVLNLKGKK